MYLTDERRPSWPSAWLSDHVNPISLQLSAIPHKYKSLIRTSHYTNNDNEYQIKVLDLNIVLQTVRP